MHILLPFAMNKTPGHNYFERAQCYRRPIDGLLQNKILKIIIVGDSNVGKTCLTYRFCERAFLIKTDATIGVDFHERTVKIGEEDVKLQLWDTAGQERFRKSMVKHYYRNVNAVVIVYDMTKINTFNSVEGWVAECAAQGLGADIPMVLVATHCDRPDNRVVTTSTAQRLADQHGMPLFETSACLDSEAETVDAIFMTLAHKLHSQQPFRVASLKNSPARIPRSMSVKKLTQSRTLSSCPSNNCC